MKKEAILELRGISKSFNGLKVVDDVSLSVNRGEVFGLIGPNGSGKTTIIRMIMGMLKVDDGEVKIMGRNWCDAVSNKVGYLPEERGLYEDLTVAEVVAYLASLKGVVGSEAVAKAGGLLSRFGLSIDSRKKIKEFSHGMAQFVQLVVSVVHDPDLVILDEPFAGLDPVSCGLFGDIIKGLESKGRTVIMSTHRMEEVEALCHRVFMIDRGRCVLYGDLRGIKERYKKGVVRVEVDGELGELDGVLECHNHGGCVDLLLVKGVEPEDILRQLLGRGLRIKQFVVKLPTLHEVFVKVVGEDRTRIRKGGRK